MYPLKWLLLISGGSALWLSKWSFFRHKPPAKGWVRVRKGSSFQLGITIFYVLWYDVEHFLIEIIPHLCVQSCSSTVFMVHACQSHKLLCWLVQGIRGCPYYLVCWHWFIVVCMRGKIYFDCSSLGKFLHNESYHNGLP